MHERATKIHEATCNDIPAIENDPAVMQLFRQARTGELELSKDHLGTLSKWEWVTVPFAKVPSVRQM